MTRALRALLAFPLVLLFVSACGGLAAQTVDELVEGLQSKYEKVGSFSASFDQVFQGSNVQLRESGTVMMKKPGKMYWEYTHPTRKFFITDGKKSYFYVPRDNQVLVSDLELNDSYTPLLFLVGKGNLQEDFQVAVYEEEKPLKPDHIMLQLIPQRPQSRFSYLLLEVDPSSHLIHRLVVVEPIGTRNAYILHDVEENVRIPDGKFEFEIPPGVEIIRQ